MAAASSVGQADVHELFERVLLGIDDAHRPESCADQFDRSLDDASEHLREIAVLHHGLRGAQQGAQSPLGAQDALALRDERRDRLLELGARSVRKRE